MTSYLVRRLLAAAMMLVTISALTFLMFYAGPTDPARLTCGRSCSPQSIADNRRYLGLDKPVVVQYGEFAKGLVAGRDYPDDPDFAAANPAKVTHCSAPCLGYSVLQHQLVTTMVRERLPVTLSITFGAFLMWICGGVGAGVLAAFHHRRWPDRILTGAALILYSFPAFFVGLMMYNLLSTRWGLLPPPIYVPLTDNALAWARGLILPWISVAALYAAGYLRLTRTYVLETAGEDYLRTARAKGLSPLAVVFKHNLRSALTPIVTVAGLDLGGLLAGSAITETIFNFQGLGRAAVQSVSDFDLPVIVALVLLAAFFVIMANLAVDLLYAVIDPRVRLNPA